MRVRLLAARAAHLRLIRGGLRSDTEGSTHACGGNWQVTNSDAGNLRQAVGNRSRSRALNGFADAKELLSRAANRMDFDAVRRGFEPDDGARLG